MVKKKSILSIVILFSLNVLLLTGCGMQKEVLISGRTMGTVYHIKVISGYFEDLSALREKIEIRLEEINQSMSTYRPDSEISRFNRLSKTETMAVSADFYKVLKVADKIYALSGGAWDGTVKPLVDLWGFGNVRSLKKAPAEAEIKKRLLSVGFSHIRILESGRVGKKIPKVTLDFASIAKGFGVDAVADLIRREGYKNFLVEIGGEVVAAGVRKDGKPWVVGISNPSPKASPDSVYQAVSISSGAMATSGDYRNYFELDGVRYSHVLDPRNGYPVHNRVVSVSILAADCTFADGLATAVMVMGPEKGKALIDRLDGVEGLILVEGRDGILKEFPSNGFYKQRPEN